MLAQVPVGSDAVVCPLCLIWRPLVTKITIKDYYGVVSNQRKIVFTTVEFSFFESALMATRCIPDTRSRLNVR